jgi:hypothetical protein
VILTYLLTYCIHIYIHTHTYTLTHTHTHTHIYVYILLLTAVLSGEAAAAEAIGGVMLCYVMVPLHRSPPPAVFYTVGEHRQRRKLLVLV